MALSSKWDISWLDVDPVNGVVEPAGSMDIQLTFDTTDLALDECYTDTLKIEFNDPYATEVFLPVELCVEEALYNIYLPIIIRN